MRLPAASVAAACLLGAGCGGGDLVLPDGPAAAEAVHGNEQVAEPGAELPDPIVVKVSNAQGRPVRDVGVAFKPADEDAGEITPDTARTDADGEAEARWVLGDRPGEQRAVAEVVGTGLDVVSFTATAVEAARPPSAERSSVSASPESIEVVTGLSVITVTVRDDQGDPVRGAEVTLAATGTGNVLTQPSERTDDDGVAQGTLQGLTPGTRVVSAFVNGAVLLAEIATVTVTPAAVPARLAFVVQPTDTRENEPISPPPAVAVVDQDGDIVPVSGIEIRLELIPEHGHASHELEGRTERVTEDGVAVFPQLEVDRDHRNYRIRARAPDRPELGSVDSDFFDVEN